MKITGRLFVIVILCFVMAGVVGSSVYAAEGKIGYVDLRRAFYEYEKTKSLETELNALTEERQKDRSNKIQEITKLRDEAELLSGDARTKKQGMIDQKLGDLQEFDRETRQQLLNRKNDMFREVIDDIQKIVEEIGEKEGYDYVLDSRNVMYAKKDYDLTDKVVEQLNKKK